MNAHEWHYLNAQLVQTTFHDKVVLIDHQEFTWLIIREFDLPPGWLPNTSNLLLTFPGVKRSIQTPPDSFYLDKGLRHENGCIPEHYFEGRFCNEFSDKGYAWFSFHVQDWKPSTDVVSGDSWLTLIDIVYQGLVEIGAK